MRAIHFLRKIAVTFIVIFLTFTQVLSQDNFIPGYVIKNNRDTIRGQIDYGNWKRNPSEVKFRPEGKTTVFALTPGVILEFGVEDDVYRSGFVEIEESLRKTYQLTEDSNLAIRKDSVFLQTLINGEKSLYFFKSRMGNDNFYIQGASGYELLIYKRYFKKENSKQSVFENKRYLGQLSFYLQDCSNISSKLENTPYSVNGLTKLFQNYYGCISSDVSFEKGEDKATWNFGLLAGLSNSYLSFESTTFVYLQNAELEPSVDFTAGLSLEYVFPRNNGKWSIYNELIYTSYLIKGEHASIYNQFRGTITGFEIGRTNIRLNNMVRIKFPANKVSFFVNAGISNSFLISETNHRVTDVNTNLDDDTIEGRAIPLTKSHEPGIIIGAGMKVGKFSLEPRWEYGAGISNNVSIITNSLNLYLLLGFTF